MESLRCIHKVIIVAVICVVAFSYIANNNARKPVIFQLSKFYEAQIAKECNNNHNYLPNTTTAIPSTVELTTPQSRRQCGKEVFVLSLRYRDQMTGGAMNIHSLQCWANSLSLPAGYSASVVEPFIAVGSKYGVNFPSEPGAESFQNANEVRLRDYFNFSQWIEYSLKNRSYANLSSWEHFLQCSPRQLIVIQSTKECREGSTQETALSNEAKMFFKRHNFAVVRTLCYSITTAYTAKQFEKYVYGSFSPTNTSIVFTLWGGVVTKPPKAMGRLVLTDTETCHREKNNKAIMYPSSKVISDSERYSQQYITNDTHKVYIAVMFRFEYSAILKSKMPQNKQYHEIMKCIENIGNTINKLKVKYHTQSVFIAMDCGEFGSVTFRKQEERTRNRTTLTSKSLERLCQALHDHILGNSATLSDWEESFTRTAQINSPGYIALMQKTLASRATCLLQVGGGSFQKTAAEMHRTFHHGKSCVQQVCPHLNYF